MKELNGLEVAERITRDHPGVKALILSMHANEEYVLRALRAASGYMLKDSAIITELKLAIEAVLRRENLSQPDHLPQRH